MKFFSVALVFVLPLLTAATPFVTCQSATPSYCSSLHSCNSEAAKSLLKKYNLASHPDTALGMISKGCTKDVSSIADSDVPVECSTAPNSINAIGCLPIAL
ncbi:hypothetical protein BC835DRAFT_1423435 [Cytidiella melzeri]|nr:hypothetical protein BC835DRAFT_1423435 [Cytidiella melzeri]